MKLSKNTQEYILSLDRFRGRSIAIREQRVVSALPELEWGTGTGVTLEPPHRAYRLLTGIAISSRTAGAWDVVLLDHKRGVAQALGCTDFWPAAVPGRIVASMDLDPAWPMDLDDGPFYLDCMARASSPAALVMWTFLEVSARGGN